jgi:small subunit ribosomal protein S10
MGSLKLQKLRISVKAYESAVLDNACVKIIDAVKASDTKVVGPIPLPTKLRRYCVLTSPHVNKKARDHFEIRTHKRIIDVYKPTDLTLENLKDLDISAGVDVEVKNF